MPLFKSREQASGARISLSKKSIFKDAQTITVLVTFFLFIPACLKLKKANSPLFEDFVQAITATLISRYSRQHSHSASAAWTPQQSLPLKTCSEILVQLLEWSNDADPSRDHLLSGLLVDWCEIVDPEVVHVHPLLQRLLLFRDRLSMPSWDRSLTSREDRSPSSYLLGLLTHQACWETLQDCLDWLLSHDGEENRYKRDQKLKISISR